MNSNVLRWNFHTTTANNPNALTILIEGHPLSICLGYRVASRAHLFNRDFMSFFRCILMTQYLGVVYNDTYKCTRDLCLMENLQDLTFKRDIEYSPIMCIRNEEVFYLDQSCGPMSHDTNISIERHPSLEEFASKMDVNLVLNFITQYLGQRNIKVFGKIIMEIIEEWTSVYVERDQRESPLSFFLEISPSHGDFFLFHSLVDYVHSLPRV